MTHILYVPVPNFRGAKIEIAADLLNFHLEFNRIQTKDLKSKQYLAKHPLGKVPLLQTPSGYIFESNAILRYIARKGKGLYGNNSWESASIDQWLEFSSNQLEPVTSEITNTLRGNQQTTKEKYSAFKKELFAIYKVMDAHLKTRTYFVADSLSIADIAIACVLYRTYRLVLDQKARQSVANLSRWYINIASIPHFQNYFGKPWLCSKELEPTFVVAGGKEQEKISSETKQSNQTKTPKQPKAPKTKTSKAPQQKKQPKPKQIDEEEEEQPLFPVQKKKVNPLDLLQKSPFNLDDFKREFLNTNDKATVLKQFWTKYDPIGYSIWKVKYNKVEGENTVGWLTGNLKNGFLRNIDHFRKYSFSCGGVYGIEGNFEIQSIWMWRGTEIPEEWKEHQSYDSHLFERLDVTKEEVKSLVEQYWLKVQEGQFVEGLPIFDVGYFK